MRILVIGGVAAGAGAATKARRTDENAEIVLFEKGGYVGVNFWPVIVGEPANIDRVIDHIAHMYDVGGEGKVGFGSDFDGIERKPEGLHSPADFPALLDGLRRRGFSESDVESVAGKALLGYYQRIAV